MFTSMIFIKCPRKRDLHWLDSAQANLTASWPRKMIIWIGLHIRKRRREEWRSPLDHCLRTWLSAKRFWRVLLAQPYVSLASHLHFTHHFCQRSYQPADLADHHPDLDNKWVLIPSGRFLVYDGNGRVSLIFPVNSGKDRFALETRLSVLWMVSCSISPTW